MEDEHAACLFAASEQVRMTLGVPISAMPEGKP